MSQWLEKVQQLDPKAKFVRENDKMIGEKQKEGRLAVEMVYSRGDNRGSYYYCSCECGEHKTVWGAHFRTGHTKSCGCFAKESSRNNMLELQKTHNNKKDLTGQQHEWLVALYPTEKRKYSQEVVWVCKCLLCGKECEKSVTEFQRTNSCGCSTTSQGELKVKALLEQAGLGFEQQKTFSTCKYPETNYEVRFDFFVDGKYLIEYDGIQHFKSTTFGGDIDKFEVNKKHDVYKNKWCLENNIPLIRIPYTKFKTLNIEDLLLETSEYIISKECY